MESRTVALIDLIAAAVLGGNSPNETGNMATADECITTAHIADWSTCCLLRRYTVARQNT